MRVSAILAIISALSMTALAIPAPAPEDFDIAEATADLAARDAPAEAVPDDFAGDLAGLDDDDDDDDYENSAGVLQKRGWGCTIFGGNDSRCHKHCKSIRGYRGGYCKLGGICKCY
ncbi:hypothetical protein AJ78_03101 [Emergomyces pasteurianus Ep9510]|uniref:Invertebrate defensins family profile domain-containing protein n=1 Tax=Emergomyces pasteurianus Ep9510 TaxID=1447872 RepID=A0A1J9Q947_9EURO|nr:hypothetical protein AJ78_03101 [Emergomyces pasteurianus Ep9510]